MAKTNPIIINSRKLDGHISRSWRANLIEETPEMFLFAGVFEFEVDHVHLGVIRRGTISYEYFWKQRWYSVYRFEEPEGHLRNFYCNINFPPNFENGVLDFVDLDLDILVNNDLTYQVLDRDEFVQNAKKYSYSKEIISGCERTIDELTGLIRKMEFPFSPALSRLAPNLPANTQKN